MNDGFGSTFITVSDDDDNEFELEHISTLDIEGEVYMAFLPADMDEDDENFGLVILKAVGKDDEEVLTTVDDEDELAMVFESFVELLSDEEEVEE